MPSKKCPVCGVSVKMENLERHVKDQHPKANVKLDKLLTVTERRKAQTAKAPPRPAMTRRGKQVVVVAGVVIAVLVAFIVLYPRGNTGLAVGQTAPDFTLTTSTGGTVHLAEVISLRNQPLLLEFMDIDCQHCINEVPILVDLYATYSGQVTFYSIDVNLASTPPDDTADLINAFKASHGTPWEYLNPRDIQFDSNIMNTYQIAGTPTIYILNARGAVSPIECPENQGGPSHCAGEVGYAILAAALDVALRS